MSELETQNAELIEQINSLQKAYGRMVDEKAEEKRELKEHLEKANERVKELEDKHLNLVLWHNLDPQQAKLYSDSYASKFAIENQIKGIESAIAYAPSKGKYSLPLLDTTDLYDYCEQLRKEQDSE